MGDRFSTALFASLVSSLVGCSPTVPSNSPAGPNEAQVRAFVTILPQLDFVRRIGGERVHVDCLVGPGQSHHTYEPTPRQMTELARAQVYFAMGVPCEHSLLPRIADVDRDILIVDTSAGVSFRHGDACAHLHPAGQSDADDHHSSNDPHIWLDPRLVKIQARHIRDALSRVDAAGKANYQKNCADFEDQLDQLHAELAARLAPYRGREFIVFHPAYGYFADAYALVQVAVEEDGKEPTVKHLTRLIDLARSEGIKVIFVQPQFASAGAAAVAAAVQGRIVPLDPMTVDYLRDMREISQKIAAGFSRNAEPEKLSALDR